MSETAARRPASKTRTGAPEKVVEGERTRTVEEDELVLSDEEKELIRRRRAGSTVQQAGHVEWFQGGSLARETR